MTARTSPNWHPPGAETFDRMPTQIRNTYQHDQNIAETACTNENCSRRMGLGATRTLEAHNGLTVYNFTRLLIRGPPSANMGVRKWRITRLSVDGDHSPGWKFGCRVAWSRWVLFPGMVPIRAYGVRKLQGPADQDIGESFCAIPAPPS